MTAEKLIRLMVVDDHPVVRRGIALLLSTEPDLELVAEADNGRQAIQQFRAHRPDVTLMDLQEIATACELRDLEELHCTIERQGGRSR